jgi:hydroxymethylpyrimidine pyrophosphatase-like HAD family hydrolase
VEILSPNVHKGHGLKQLCLEIGVPLEEVIAFGDGDNDIEFLELAGKGIAMKNARDTLKAVADEITEWTNDEVS